MADLILLCRHVRSSDVPTLVAAMEATGPGGRPAPAPPELIAVAKRLADTLDHERIRVVGIRHAVTGEAALTATWLVSSLASPPDLDVHPDLSPSHFGSWAQPRPPRGTGPDKDPVDKLLSELIKPLRDSSGTGRAILVVGHMPQLAWLGERLTGNRSLRTALADGYLTPLALKHGEVAAIECLGPRGGLPCGQLRWTVAPDERQAIDDLRAKIKSKMETAKLLGGLITLVLGSVILDPGRVDELSRGGDSWAVGLATVSFLIAIGLYLRTMYAYDGLLMPARYWSAGAPDGATPRWLLRRPPSSAAWVLYQNMLRVWTYLFTPATVAVVVGLLALAYAAFEPGLLEGAIAGITLIGAAIYAARFGPVLGTQD